MGQFCHLKSPCLLKFINWSNNHTVLEGTQRINTSVFLFAMNKAKYDKLPDDLKKVIDQNSGLDLATRMGIAWDKVENPGIAAAKKCGNEFFTIPAAEVAQWKEVTRPVTDKWVAGMDSKGLDGKALLADALALIKKHSK